MAAGGSQRREWVLATLDRYQAPLTRYALRLVGDEDGARDAVQHAFLQLCSQSPDALDQRVAPWLFAVCRHKAMDLVRQRRRASSLEDREHPAFTSREPDPAMVAERHDLYARLSQAVAQLPPGQREAIDLWVEGFGYREIAQIIRQTEGNVRVLVHRGLKSLRQHPLARELLGVAAAGEPGPCRSGP